MCWAWSGLVRMESEPGHSLTASQQSIETSICDDVKAGACHQFTVNWSEHQGIEHAKKYPSGGHWAACMPVNTDQLHMRQAAVGGWGWQTNERNGREMKWLGKKTSEKNHVMLFEECLGFVKGFGTSHNNCWTAWKWSILWCPYIDTSVYRTKCIHKSVLMICACHGMWMGLQSGRKFTWSLSIV